MFTTPENTFFDEVLDFLASTPTPEDILQFKPSEQLQARATYLLQQNRADNLSAEEAQDLEEIGRINHLMSMLKIRASLSSSLQMVIICRSVSPVDFSESFVAIQQS